MKAIHATHAYAASILLSAVMPRVVAGAETAKPSSAAAPPRALSDDDLANPITFTRAFGLLRFFHPSDQAASAPWDELAVKGVEKLERARSSVAGTADRSARLAAVVEARTAVRHFFPYFEETAIDWDEQLVTALGRAATDRTKADFLVTLGRMMAALRDGHAGAYLDEAPPRTAPPVALTIVDGEAVVVKAWGEAAAALPPGSVLLAIDGEMVVTRMARTAAVLSASTPGWLDACVARELLAGAPGTTLPVVARLPGGKVQKATLVRRPASGDQAPRPSSPPAREARQGVWYVNLATVPQAELEALYPELADAKGIVFDLRGHPQVDPSFLQHLIDAPVKSARLEVPVKTGPGPEALAWEEKRWTLAPVAPRVTRKVAFLAGGGSISYGETLLDVIDTYKIGVIVGATSAGTNGTVVELKLPGGFAVSWTGMRVRRPDGARLFGVGIPPTVPAAPTVAGLAAGRDEVLERAVEEVTR